MKIIEPGHVYKLSWLDGDDIHYKDGHWNSELIFVNRETGSEHPGTQTQEVLRALINRTQHCDKCLRWDGNDRIIYHLRMALALHEARAIERKVEKGIIAPEAVETAEDGHFRLRIDPIVVNRMFD